MTQTQTQTQQTESDDALEAVATLFDFVFGDAIPVRRFEDEEEFDYLAGGAVYGTEAACDACGAAHAPFIVTARTETTTGRNLWTGTCLECFSQLRVPYFRNSDGEWVVDGEEARLVALDTVPTYREQDVGVQPGDHGNPTRTPTSGTEEDDA